MSLLFFFLGKTEEVFGMHEWAEKQEEWIKCGKARKLKWKIFTRMRGREMREIRKAGFCVFACAFRFLFLFATRSLHAMLPDFTFKWHDISHLWMEIPILNGIAQIAA